MQAPQACGCGRGGCPSGRPGAPAFAHGRGHHATKAAKSPGLQVDAARRTVRFTVPAGDGSDDGGLDFGHTAGGQTTRTLPANWRVDAGFKSEGSISHGVVFEAWSASPGSGSPTPAFKGAEPPGPVAGTAPDSGAGCRFKATKAGRHRMICALPGRAEEGMGDVFVVSRTAMTATRKA